MVPPPAAETPASKAAPTMTVLRAGETRTPCHPLPSGASVQEYR